MFLNIVTMKSLRTRGNAKEKRISKSYIKYP